MSIGFKDYYQILGVSKDASAEAVKKAFRELARRYHPDKVQGSGKEQAEHKFKEINEAYEVLGDVEKRRKYDTLGADWDQPQYRGGFGGARGGSGGPGEAGYEFHFGGTGFSDFFEQFFGMGSDPFQRDSAPRGRGARGFGQSVRGNDVEAEIMVTLEEVLNGSDRQISVRKVDASNGEEQRQTFQVKVPRGVREGQRIRLAGQGGAGLGGGRPGDLLLRIRYARHPFFSVRGDSLIYDLDLAPWEAVLGTEVTMETLGGRISLKIKPGSQAGTVLRVPGRGLPRKDGTSGDLHVALHVQVPASTETDERLHWEALAKNSKFRPRDS